MRLRLSPVKVRPIAKKPNGGDTLKLERRASEREPSTGSISATYTNGKDRYGLTHLQVIDRSDGGIGALTRSALEPGMRITICPEGSRTPWLGAVCVRCEPARVGAAPGKEELYHVGLAYTPRRAA